MRKIIKILCLFLAVFLSYGLNGCLISYFYRNPLPIEVLSVKTYNLQTGEEILGEEDSFVWRFSMEQEESQTAMLSIGRKIELMNSAAPVFLYYVIDVKPGDVINVEFEVYVRKKAGLSALYLSNEAFGFGYDKFAVKDITDNGKGYFTVKYTYTVQDGIYYLSTHSWENAKGELSTMPSRGGETYNCGVFFNVNGVLDKDY